MNILVSYHNFCRDFRGSWLLKKVLEALGHRVWVRPHWNHEATFVERHPVDVIVACQIAEDSTAHIARVARERNVHLVINSSEHFGKDTTRDTNVLYDRTQYNDKMITFQTVATEDAMAHIRRHPHLVHKDRYKWIGFPRLDLSIDQELRQVGVARVRRKYGVMSGGRCYLYLSSLLFEETYADVSEADMQSWNYRNMLDRSHVLRKMHEKILQGFIDRYLGPEDVLLIKKHPWDVSRHFVDTFRDPRVRIVDPGEYIVPCLAVADAVLHCYSTSSVESWIMGKPTIAIVPSKMMPEIMMLHMKYEVFAETLDEVISCLEHYPHPGPIERVWDFLGPKADGKATIRLAQAISSLSPPPPRKLASMRMDVLLRRRLATWREEVGLKLWQSDAAERNPKNRRFREWENMRRPVIDECAVPFADYIQRHRALIGG